MSTNKLVGQQNQCPGCGRFFARNSAFEAHRVGVFGLNRRCMDDQEMLVTFNLGVDGFFRRKAGEATYLARLRENAGKGCTGEQGGAV